MPHLWLSLLFPPFPTFPPFKHFSPFYYPPSHFLIFPNAVLQLRLVLSYYSAEGVQACVDRYGSQEGMTQALNLLLIEVRGFRCTCSYTVV